MPRSTYRASQLVHTGLCVGRFCPGPMSPLILIYRVLRSRSQASVSPVLQSRGERRTPYLRPRRRRFFYGYVVLAICVVLRLLKAVGQNNVFAVSVPLIIDDLGLDAGLFGRVWGGATFCAATLQPAVGMAFDRWGARLCLPISVAVLAIGLLGLSAATNSLHVFFAAVLIRGTAIGAIDGFTQSLVALWFKRRRGRAAAAMSAVIAPLMGLLTKVMSLCNEAFGWRETLVVCSAILFASCVPTAALTRDRPQLCGTGTDGDALLTRRASDADGPLQATRDSRSPLGAPPSPSTDAHGGPGKAAMAPPPSVCSRTLSILLLTSVYAATVGSGIDLYTVAIATEAGATYDVAAWVFVPMGFVSAACSVLAGCAADRGAPPHR